MADDVGQRQERQPMWIRIFSAFKIALDAKKLVLAALGILITACCWWLLAVTFYSMRSMPAWKNAPAESETAWKDFKVDLGRWNLLHELAGKPDSEEKETLEDIASSPAELDFLKRLSEGSRRLQTPVQLKKEAGWELVVDNKTFKIVPKVDALPLEPARGLTLRDIQIVNEKAESILVGATLVQVEQNFDDLRKLRDEPLTPEQLRAELERETDRAKRDVGLNAIKRFQAWTPRIKPSGRLRTLPWFEHRGENPYLIVTGLVQRASASEEHRAPASPGHYASYFFVQLMPVLLEPIFKFLTPVAYLFDSRAGWLEYIYLFLVILVTLAVWGFFGGAITRIAAVQFARNERISMREALLFTQERFVSYFSAPLFPLIFLLVLTLALIVFGFFTMIPAFGDIVIAGLLWPIVLLVGFIMAVVLVGLVGWPLMHATISTEGSDSFDALSHSYSYVYGAPWQYLWYAFVAAVYGAAVVFFVTFMGSLVVYLGKWAIAETPFMSRADREPSFLFVKAPTSFGWRDLLIHDNPDAAEHIPGTNRWDVKPAYRDGMTWYNKAGAWLVAAWLYVFFLLMIGFSYSFFWTASTIIYFLMRHHVDDTDLDEVHLDSEGFDEPPTRPAAQPGSPAPKPNTISLTTIEAPRAANPSAVAAPPPGQPSATVSAAIPPPPPVSSHDPTPDATPPPPEVPVPPPGNGDTH